MRMKSKTVYSLVQRRPARVHSILYKGLQDQGAKIGEGFSELKLSLLLEASTEVSHARERASFTLSTLHHFPFHDVTMFESLWATCMLLV